MYRFAMFLVSAVVFIYIGVWFFLAIVAFMIVVWFMLVLWNRVLSEILPLPEIGWFGGIIFTIFVIVISTTLWGIWVLATLPPVVK